MRHNIVLAVGAGLGTGACGVTRYVTRTASAAIAGHYKALWWHADSAGVGEFSPVTVVKTGDDFRADLHGEIQTVIGNGNAIPGGDGRLEHIENELTSLFADTITIGTDNGSTNTLLITAVVALRDREAVAQLMEIERAVRGCSARFAIDIIGLCHDVAGLLGSDVTMDDDAGNPLPVKILHNEDREALSLLVDAKKQQGSLIGHIMPMGNINCAGRSLKLDGDTATRLLGELVMLEIEKYDSLWTFPIDPGHEVTAVGLSALVMDDFYFEQYLLRKAYLHVLDREGVTQDKVDINKISPVANSCVMACMSQFSKFWQQEVAPLIERHLTDEDIVAQVSPKVTTLFNTTIFNNLTDYLDNSSLSLPERQCVLALVLGFDDTLMDNYLFATQHSVDDIIVEPMQLLVDENNRMEPKERPLTRPLKPVEPGSGDVLEVYVPIDRLRTMLNEIRDTTSHIRSLDEHLADLKRQGVTTEQSKKRISGEWFSFDGRQYRLLDNNLVQPQLDETYNGDPSRTLPENCDLSGDFPKVRDQGKMGACAAFALTSVFEFMMRRLGRESDPLSPAFVYYNARVIGEHRGVDSGTTLRDTIRALSESGVCLDEFMPYETATPQSEPTAEAVEDGRLRLVTGAAGIVVDENDEDKTLRDVKSALSDGFPVVTALRVLDSFASSTGFVSVPTEDELAAAPSGGHAMVIVGYDDKTGYFYVRNSWGEKFGDKGYCYIPYSYITDKNLCHGLAIIKGINMADGGKSVAPAAGHMMDFDRTNAAIDMAITLNLVNSEQKHLKAMKQRYSALKLDGDMLLADLGTPSKRKALRTHARARLTIELSEASQAVDRAQAERAKALGDHDERTHEVTFKWWVAIAIMALLTAVTIWYGFNHDRFTPTWLGSGITAFFVLLMLSWKHIRRNERREMDQTFKARIARLVEVREQCAVRLRESDLRHEVAGRFIDEFRKMHQQLITRYSDVSSMTGNLATWFRNEQSKQSAMTAALQPPFVALLDNDTLDAYFSRHAGQITGNICVSRYLCGYDRNEAGLMSFQKSLKQEVLNWLANQVADFDMVKLLTGNASFDYVTLRQSVSEYVASLLSMSQPFVQYRQLSGATSPTVRLLTNVGGSNDAFKQQIDDCVKPVGLPPGALSDTSSPLRLTLLQLHPLRLTDLM